MKVLNENSSTKFVSKLVLWIIATMFALSFSVGGYFAKAQIDSLKEDIKEAKQERKEARLERDTLKGELTTLKIGQAELKILMQLMLEKQGVSKLKVSKALDSLNGE